MNKKQLYILFTLVFISICSQGQRVYYIDNKHGNNSNHGMDTKAAWKSLDKINNFKFQDGDQILLKRGQEFSGSIHIQSTETVNPNFKLGAYGSGNRPLINASGYDYAIKILDAGNFTIADIETKAGNNAGIFIGCTNDGMELGNIRIDNCYVHDIGDTTKLDWDYSTTTGGIIVVNGNFNSQGKPQYYNSVFNNVIIDGCTVRYNSRWTCISITSGKQDETLGDSNMIRNCITEFSVADGIRMNGVKNSRIEYCFMYRNGSWPKKEGRNLGGLGAWFFNAVNCTIQYCEASYVGANTTDGGAFDIDYWQENSTVQYCYGHHCAGYGVSVFGADPKIPTVNSTVRYNIFTHNGRDSKFVYEGDFFIFTWSGGLLNGVNIHDNLSIWNPVSPSAAIQYNATFTGDRSNTFTNNTIISKQTLLANYRNDSLISNNNIYWAMPDNWGDDTDSMWVINRQKINSFQKWQQISGQDNQSKFENPGILIPDWYSAEKVAGNFISIDILGKNAPEFSTITESGIKQKSSQLKTGPTIISFIDLSEIIQPKDFNRSRAQLVYLKSMLRQHSEKGLKVVLVDTPSQIVTKTINRKDFICLVNDNREGFLYCKTNQIDQLRKEFGVKSSSMTVLISPNGEVKKCWKNLVLPAQLAFAIEEELNK